MENFESFSDDDNRTNLEMAQSGQIGNPTYTPFKLPAKPGYLQENPGEQFVCADGCASAIGTIAVAVAIATAGAAFLGGFDTNNNRQSGDHNSVAPIATPIIPPQPTTTTTQGGSWWTQESVCACWGDCYERCQNGRRALEPNLEIPNTVPQNAMDQPCAEGSNIIGENGQVSLVCIGGHFAAPED